MINILSQLFDGPTEFYLADPKRTTKKLNGGTRWAVEREFKIPLEKALEGHITGTLNKGVVLPPLVWNEKKKRFECKWGAIDVDGNIYKDDNFKREILNKVKKLALPLCACFSKSKGIHLYIRFKDWTDAQKVVDILHTFLHKLGLPQDTECFPKQSGGVKIGNGIMLPFMYGKGNDWIKEYNGTGFTKGSLQEFPDAFFATKTNADDIEIDLPEEVKAKSTEKANGADFLNSQTTGPNKFTILKKIKDGTIEQHPTIGGTYYSWIQIVICKAIKQGCGDNEILNLIKEVHKDKIDGVDTEYTWPESYKKQINYTRGERQLNTPNPGDTELLEGKGILDGFIDEELERKQNEFFEDTIYVKLDDRWYSKKTGKEYKEKTIKVVNGHLFPDVVKAFAKDEERKQEVEMGVYRPDLYKSKDDPIVIDEEGLSQLNTYRPGGVEPMEADTPQRKKELELFKELIRKLTENENVGFTDTKEERPLYDYFLDHLSMPFQRPGEKVRSSIVMHSFRNQIGKSTVFEIEKQGLGKDNCIVITPENAIRREKAFLPNQLVLIDELLIDGDYKKKIAVLNILKPLMTADEHDCRPLFKESRQIHSRCSFMCFTNHKDAVAIKEFDARYTCIDVNKTREEMGGDKFFNQIWNQNGTLKGTIANVAKHFLSTRKISENFDPAGVSLDTKFRRIMSEQGGHPLFPVVQQKYREGDTPFDRSVISISETYFYLKNEEKLKGSLNELSDCLETLKCQKLGEVKHRNSGKTPTLYITKNFEFFEGMTKAEIANNYWLPIECGVMCVSSEKYNLSQADIVILREKQEEIANYEKMMDKEPEDPDVIEIDDLKDIPEEIKQRERDINEK